MTPATVIAAIDLGPSTARVLYHASGFAQLFGASLKILYVDSDAAAARQRVLNTCLELGPYQTDFQEDQIVVRSGRVSEAIAREAQAQPSALVVMGSRGHGGVAKLLLGSTSEAVLRAATTPVLLVPPIDMDIISLGDRAALTCGRVIAAVDLAERCDHQLAMASLVAHLSAQPLVLMTVAKSRLTDHAASAALRESAHWLQPARPRSLIVRRGSVAEEISRCAIAEDAGLVIMGLRASPRCQPGSIASAVLKTRRAFVMAVPGC
jgi:nucleotide-binding universal stress UspA family protein